MLIKFKYYFVLLFFLAPLLFIYVNGDNGWGGDFAQYILQANNILEAKPQAIQPYIFNSNYSSLAPPSYYPGFPYILSFAIKHLSSNPLSLAYFITLTLILTSIFWYKFLTKYFNEKIVLIGIIVSLYSNFFLTAKNETLADIPFALFIILNILLVEKFIKEPKWNLSLLILLSALLAISIKPLGLILVVCYCVLIAFNILLKPLNFKQKSIYLAVISLVSISFYLFVVPYLLGANKENNAHFIDLFLLKNPIYTFLENLNYYQIKMSTLLSTNNKLYQFFNLILVQIISLSFLFGLFNALKKEIRFKDIFFLIYILIILLFPFQQGFRYLIPVFPVILYYILFGIQSFKFPTNKKIFIIGFCLLFGFITPTVLKLKHTINTTYTRDQNYGPNTQEAIQLFKYIIDNTNKNDVIVFSKPRVLGLKTNRRSFSNQPNFSNLDLIEEDINQFNSKYILQSVELKNKALDTYIYQKNLKPVFENSKFTLYKKNNF